MILGENIGSVFNEGKEIRRVYSLGKLVWEKGGYSFQPFTVCAVDDTVTVRIFGNTPASGTSQTIYYKYSINGGDWIQTDSSDTVTLNKDDVMCVMGENAHRCWIKGLCDVSGNIMSLEYGDDFYRKKSWGSRTHGSLGFFYSCDIRNAENLILPAKEVGENGYNSMFQDCVYLTTPPKLPATTLWRYCYDYMFDGCSSLTNAPELPATELPVGCYRFMFQDCKKLTNAPELPADYLRNECYREMFSGCTSLKYIKCHATSNIYDNAESWLKNVETNGTLVCKRVNGGKNPIEDYIPSTWTVEYMD